MTKKATYEDLKLTNDERERVVKDRETQAAAKKRGEDEGKVRKFLDRMARDLELARLTGLEELLSQNALSDEASISALRGLYGDTEPSAKRLRPFPAIRRVIGMIEARREKERAKGAAAVARYGMPGDF